MNKKTRGPESPGFSIYQTKLVSVTDDAYLSSFTSYSASMMSSAGLDSP